MLEYDPANLWLLTTPTLEKGFRGRLANIKRRRLQRAESARLCADLLRDSWKLVEKTVALRWWSLPLGKLSDRDYLARREIRALIELNYWLGLTLPAIQEHPDAQSCLLNLRLRFLPDIERPHCDIRQVINEEVSDKRDVRRRLNQVLPGEIQVVLELIENNELILNSEPAFKKPRQRKTAPKRRRAAAIAVTQAPPQATDSLPVGAGQAAAEGSKETPGNERTPKVGIVATEGELSPNTIPESQVLGNPTADESLDSETILPGKYRQVWLRETTGLSNGALNKYAKLAGVPTPGRGKRNHRYSPEEVGAILSEIMNTSGESKVRQRCRQGIEELKEIS